jgi:phosphatidylinositol alpha-1,6-mannosyltransferase
MKKTLLVTLDFYPSVGGIANYWKNLGAYMPSEKWVVLAPLLKNGVKELNAPYTIYRENFFSCCIYPRWLPIFFHVLRIAKKERSERIVVGQILPVGSAVWLASKFLRIPYSVSVHGMDVGLAARNGRKRTLCKKIFSDSEYIIANSTYTGSLVCEYGVPKEKITYIYPCASITPTVPQSAHAIPAEFMFKKIILSVGRLVKRKGFEYVIRAMPAVLEKEPNAVYVILGNGQEESCLRELVQELAIQEHVFFVKNASDADLVAWYAACAVFCMASYEERGDVEGFGIVYLDANSFGKPVIGTTSGGVSEAVLDGETGIVVSPKNSLEIEQAVLRVLSDKAYANLLGAQGRKRAEKEFQWSAQAEKLKNILQ